MSKQLITKGIGLIIFVMSCASEQKEQAPAVPKTGACTYSWYAAGWTTWCYQGYTKASCDALNGGTYNAMTVWIADTTCPAYGFPIRCLVYYKSSACLGYE